MGCVGGVSESDKLSLLILSRSQQNHAHLLIALQSHIVSHPKSNDMCEAAYITMNVTYADLWWSHEVACVVCIKERLSL